MPFNSETGRLHGAKSCVVAGSAKSSVKVLSSRANWEKAAAANRTRTYATKDCTCNQTQHTSKCRVYMTQKKRESRERLALTRPKVKPEPKPITSD